MQTSFQQIPLTIIRITDVMARTGLPKSSVYEKIKNKELTKPVSIGLKRVGWPAYEIDEIDEINRALISGADTQSIKHLVNQLTDARQNFFSGVLS